MVVWQPHPYFISYWMGECVNHIKYMLILMRLRPYFFCSHYLTYAELIRHLRMLNYFLFLTSLQSMRITQRLTGDMIHRITTSQKVHTALIQRIQNYESLSSKVQSWLFTSKDCELTWMPFTTMFPMQVLLVKTWLFQTTFSVTGYFQKLFIDNTRNSTLFFTRHPVIENADFVR